MPKCRNCGSPIFFLSEEPECKVVGGFSGNAHEVITDPRPMPIDVDPDPRGSVAIYELPSPTCAWGRHFKGKRNKYYRRLYGYAAESYVRLGGSLYNLHFDSCPKRGPRNR